jgi:hypothetical protein
VGQVSAELPRPPRTLLGQALRYVQPRHRPTQGFLEAPRELFRAFEVQLARILDVLQLHPVQPLLELRGSKPFPKGFAALVRLHHSVDLLDPVQ